MWNAVFYGIPSIKQAERCFYYTAFLSSAYVTLDGHIATPSRVDKLLQQNLANMPHPQAPLESIPHPTHPPGALREPTCLRGVSLEQFVAWWARFLWLFWTRCRSGGTSSHGKSSAPPPGSFECSVSVLLLMPLLLLLLLLLLLFFFCRRAVTERNCLSIVNSLIEVC